MTDFVIASASEAIQRTTGAVFGPWIASSLALLAMTIAGPTTRKSL